jgi:lipoprotein-anchoring transpeptidase ErfK/SrfK
MKDMNRREFLKRSGTLLAGMTLPLIPLFERGVDRQAPPASLGRIATWWRQAVRTEPSPEATLVAYKSRDEVLPLYTAVDGVPPWPSNPVWYETDGGFIHSGYVHPSENTPNGEVVETVEEPGFWAQVGVPIAEARWHPDSPYVARKLYYGTVYRVIGRVADAEGSHWYRLQEGITYSPGPYVPTWAVHRVPAEALAPLSPGRDDKWMEIRLADQMLTCYEGEQPVFNTPISSGVGGMATPRGEHRVLYKRHTKRMIGSDYDLPGVPFPVYFTWNAVAIHGTYWHNDYGRPHSHGCVNVTSDAARWIFRWVDPQASYGEHTVRSEAHAGTRVVVV